MFLSIFSKWTVFSKCIKLSKLLYVYQDVIAFNFQSHYKTYKPYHLSCDTWRTYCTRILVYQGIYYDSAGLRVLSSCKSQIGNVNMLRPPVNDFLCQYYSTGYCWIIHIYIVISRQAITAGWTGSEMFILNEYYKYSFWQRKPFK